MAIFLKILKVCFSFFADAISNNRTCLWPECFDDRVRVDCWPVVGELQGDLDEGVWTQLVLLGKLLAKPLEVEHVHVEVVDQSAGDIWKKKTTTLFWIWDSVILHSGVAFSVMNFRPCLTYLNRKWTRVLTFESFTPEMSSQGRCVYTTDLHLQMPTGGVGRWMLNKGT